MDYSLVFVSVLISPIVVRLIHLFLLIFKVTLAVGFIYAVAWGTAVKGHPGVVAFFRRFIPSMPWRDRFLATCLFCIKMLYLPLVSHSFSALRCTKNSFDDNYYVDEAPWIQCDKDIPPWSWMRPVAAVSIIFYVFGIPILWACLLFLSRKRPESLFLASLSAPFRIFWADLFFLVRKALIGVASSLIPLSSPMVTVLIVIILLVSFLCQTFFRFFWWNPDNAMEIISLAVLTLCYLLTVMSSVNRVTTSAALAMQASVLALNVRFLCFVNNT